MTKRETSRITNCVLVTRPDATGCLFDFDVGAAGHAIVNLERYLICPLEVFSDAVLEGFLKRYRETNPGGAQMTVVSVKSNEEV